MLRNDKGALSVAGGPMGTYVLRHGWRANPVVVAEGNSTVIWRPFLLSTTLSTGLRTPLK